MTFLGIASLITGALGAGISYVSATKAADTQEQLALLNAQAQTQAIQQQGQVNQMQASINEELARREVESSNANAKMLGDQAEMESSRARDLTRFTRQEAARLAGSARAAAGKSGTTDITGSWLKNLADLAREAQKKAEDITYENEDNRRALFREGALHRNQGILAGINVTGQQVAGLAAAQRATTQAAQARLDMYSQRAAASAARTQAGGQLFSAFGGLAGDTYRFFKNKPGMA